MSIHLSNWVHMHILLLPSNVQTHFREGLCYQCVKNLFLIKAVLTIFIYVTIMLSHQKHFLVFMNHLNGTVMVRYIICIF